MKLKPPERLEEVAYQVTFLVISMASYNAGQLFRVNGEMA